MDGIFGTILTLCLTTYGTYLLEKLLDVFFMAVDLFIVLNIVPKFRDCLFDTFSEKLLFLLCIKDQKQL